MAGLPTTWGVPALAQAAVPAGLRPGGPNAWRARRRRYRSPPHQSAPDMGVRLHTNSSLHGLTRNPLAPRLQPRAASTGFVIGMDNTPIIA